MPRLRLFSRLGLALLGALLLLAAAPSQTAAPPAPTSTPTLTETPPPTATLTFGEHIAVHGFDEQAREYVARNWGWGVLLAVLVVLGGIGWWARPYWKGLEKQREDKAQKRLSALLNPSKDPFEQATAAYLDRFDKKYSQFSFRGLEDVSGAKVPAFDTAYVSLRLSAAAAKQRSLGKKGGQEEETLIGAAESPEVTLDEAIQRKPCLAVIGAAGCGKSTLLQWAGVSLARFRLRGEKALEKPEQIAWVKALGNRPLLPIFIALRDYVRYCNNPQTPREINPCSLVDFIAHFYTSLWTSIAFPPDFFKRHLSQGCLLLLDGVDEVSPGQRVKVREAIEGLIDDYGATANRYLIASRSVAYHGQVEFKDFERLDVQPLSRAQRDDLIRFWMDAIYVEDEAAQNAANLSSSIENSDERIRQLARTPLMVSIFVLVYYHSKRRLPKQRAEFYYRAARVLVNETNKASAPDYPFWEKLSTETRIDLLKRVAYELYTRGQEEATLDELAAWIREESGLQDSLETAKDFLDAAANRSGLLEERGGQYGFFTHKTFHEFLTGWYVAQNKRKEWKEILTKRVPDDQWQEVLSLAAGLLALLHADDANDFIALMSSLGKGETEPLRLAGLERAALAQADFPDDRAQKNRKPLTEALLAQIENTKLTSRQRASLGLALGALGDPRLRPAALPALSQVIPAGPFRMGANAADAQKLKAQGVDEKYIWDNEKTGERDLIVTISYDYQIGLYPVANAEYRAFWEAGGYGRLDGEKPPWWSETGWQWRLGLWDTQDFSMFSKDLQETLRQWLAERPKEKRGQPFWWDDPKWNAANLPVVGVCWFEAEAYCNWLTEALRQSGQLPEGFILRLPTEAEWEKAARFFPSPQGRANDSPLPLGEGLGVRGTSFLWPWGDAWDEQKCNNVEPHDKIGQTSPVGIYPHGASPCGALDMVGNVWEWCLDEYERNAYSRWLEAGAVDPRGAAGSGLRVLRGGSWGSSRSDARCACRGRSFPDSFDSVVGFRLVLSPF